MHIPYYLFKSRRFLPVFVVQFFGALNDNLYKNAFIILLTFSLSEEANMPVALGLGIFILPFFIFSSLAGELADKVHKEKLIRWVKFAEILILGIGATVGFYWDSTIILYSVLFLMGVHSTFFGPLKYSILPQHLKTEELLFGNGWIEASTFIAILLGTILGGALILNQGGVAIVMRLLMTFAILGWCVSFFIPSAQSDNPKLKIHINFLKSTFEVLHYVWSRSYLYRIIFGISWFWFMGAGLLTIIPLLTREQLGSGPEMVTFLLIVSILGIGLGSIGSYKLLHGQISSRYVPLSGFGMSFFLLMVVIGDWSIVVKVIGILGIGICGGLLSVPLYSLLQYKSETEHRSRNIAANNIMNALFMVGSSLLALGIFSIGGDIVDLGITMAVLNLFVSIYLCCLLPKEKIVSVFKKLIKFILRILYRVEIEGMEHLEKLKGKVIVVSNHISLLDGVLFGVFFPERLVFPIDIETARVWWIRPILYIAKTLTIDSQHPFALKELIRLVEKEHWVVIFPEGRISTTGLVMKIYEGPGYVALKTGAAILPVFIEGAQYSWPFSYLKGKLRLRLFPKIRLRVFPAVKLEGDLEKSPRGLRKEAARKIYDLLTEMKMEMAKNDLGIFENLLLAGKRNGMETEIIGDVGGETLNYRQLIAKSLVMGEVLTEGIEGGIGIGLMIPNSISAVVSFFGMQSQGRVASMINYSSGSANILSACETGRIKLIWTSKKFIQRGHLSGVVELLLENGIQVKYLENSKKVLKKKRYWIKYWTALIAPEWVYRKRMRDKFDKEAIVLLFTSGSMGEPKGVVLSHQNIIANCFQLSAVVDLTMEDKILSVMPIFHAFGLTGGIIGPILLGTRVFTYPTPLHYKVIPEIVYQKGITVLFGTNTFFRGYARYANAYDFRSLRYLFGGAEKIQDNTRAIFAEKFGVRILEGYGTTEASPVICINTPLHNKSGSVGRFLPGIQYRLKEIPGIDDGKELWIQGYNVMMGYIFHEKPGIVERVEDKWLNTGDVVKIDSEGYVTIIGRTKRFAKIGGEMVALDIVEGLANILWPEYRHACISKPDKQKGEYLIFFTEKKDADLRELREFAKDQGIGALFIPRVMKHVLKIPLLGAGKPDYVILGREVEN